MGWAMTRRGINLVFFALLALPGLRARGTENGNSLALDIASAGNAHRKRELVEAASGRLFFFRYLRIVELSWVETNGVRGARMVTVEPSSDARVEFVARKNLSVQKARALATNDAVAVTGRFQAMQDGFTRIILDPVIIRYKDRPAPKKGPERLYEVEPGARYGADTSSGRETTLLPPEKQKLP